MSRKTRNLSKKPVRLISRRRINREVRELARAISRDCRGNDLLVIGILKGSFIFMADLIRELSIPVECGFVSASSYGKGTRSSGKVKVAGLEKLPIRGRNVLIVEDIIDTGRTVKRVVEEVKKSKPRRLRVCALLDKPSRREVEIRPDYIGMVVPDRFLVGYGLDRAERFRELPYVGYLKK